jgi:hypothetical protein
MQQAWIYNRVLSVLQNYEEGFRKDFRLSFQQALPKGELGHQGSCGVAYDQEAVCSRAMLLVPQISVPGLPPPEMLMTRVRGICPYFQRKPSESLHCKASRKSRSRSMVSAGFCPALPQCIGIPSGGRRMGVWKM